VSKNDFAAKEELENERLNSPDLDEAKAKPTALRQKHALIKTIEIFPFRSFISYLFSL
jgi:hypothetical protein